MQSPGLGVVWRLAYEAADCGLLSPDLPESGRENACFVAMLPSVLA